MAAVAEWVDVNFMVNRRVLVVLEESAQARLLICDHAMDNVNFLSTQVIEVFAKENATFDLYELEETHTSTVRFSNLYVNQEADSNVLLNGMTLYNGTTRNTTEVTLAGRGAEINLCGMVIADKNIPLKNHLRSTELPVHQHEHAVCDQGTYHSGCLCDRYEKVSGKKVMI